MKDTQALPGPSPLIGQGPIGKKEDSLSRRYFYKLGGGAFSMGASGLIQAIVLRSLVPAAYGNFNFLNNFFIQLTTFLDMGTSDGFYTKLSKRPGDEGLVAFYFSFVLLVCLVVVGVTAVACLGPSARLIWPGQEPRYILMGAILGITAWTGLVLNKNADAYGFTVPAEIARVATKTLGVALLALLVLLHSLNLSTLFLCWYAMTIGGGLAFLWINARFGHPPPLGLRLSPAKLKEYGLEFYHYGHPLAVYCALAFGTQILGRWLLQAFSGSVQQAFFGLSFQVCTVCVLGVTAMEPLFMREFSIAHHNEDVAAMAELFRKYIPLLYSVTACVSCFVAIQAATVVHVLGGRGYAGATTAVALMALASIHQTYDGLSGSVFFATNRTRLYRNVGIITMLFGVLLNFFLLGPTRLGGLNLGAVGLALQILATQFLGVNVQLYLNTRFLGIPFLKFFSHQLASLSAFLGLAFISRELARVCLGPRNLWLVVFFASGSCYALGVGVIAWTWPSLFGLRQKQLQTFLMSLRANFA